MRCAAYVLGYGMLLDRVRQRDVDGAPRQRVIPVAVDQLDDAVDVDEHDAPRRALYAEDGPGGHLWTIGGFHGADLYALGSSEHIISYDVYRHAAAAGRALDVEAIEDLRLNRGYGMLLTKGNKVIDARIAAAATGPRLHPEGTVGAVVSRRAEVLGIRLVVGVHSEHGVFAGVERPPEQALELDCVENLKLPVRSPFVYDARADEELWRLGNLGYGIPECVDVGLRRRP